jgi:hypothetical protein
MMVFFLSGCTSFFLYNFFFCRTSKNKEKQKKSNKERIKRRRQDEGSAAALGAVRGGFGKAVPRHGNVRQPAKRIFFFRSTTPRVVRAGRRPQARRRATVGEGRHWQCQPR